MLYPPRYGRPEATGSGPIRTGFRYGLAGVLVALASDLYFLFVDPSGTPGWILAVIAQYRTRLALALFLFLAVLAALRVRPTRLDPGVPYRSLLVRDGALAATVVAVMVGITLFLTTALQATLFAGAARDYAREAAPKIVSYVNEVRMEIRQERKDRGASPEKDQGPPAAGTGRGGRGDPATTHAAGPRPVDGQLGPARRPPRNGGRAGRRAPRPSCAHGRREARKGAPQGMRPGSGGQVAAALLLDAVFGEPPEALHPTVLMGRAISAFEKRALRDGEPEIQAPRGHRASRLAALAGVRLDTRRSWASAPGRLRWMIGAALISTALSMRGLGGAASGRRARAARRTARKGANRVGSLRRAGYGGSFGVRGLQGRRGIGRGEHERRRRRPHALRRASSARRARWHTRP